MESGKYDKRKAAFKSTHMGGSGSRSRQQCDAFRKVKRDTALFAKRLRLEQENEDYTADVNLDFSEILNNITSNDITRRLQGLTVLRQTLCSTTASLQCIADLNLVVVLSDSLISTNENIQINAAWCLTNIAAGDHDQAREVLQAVPNVILVLDSDASSTAVREQVCWTVGNIAGDCDQFRQTLLANGCLPAVLRFLARCVDINHVEGARTAAWALSNLARGSTSVAGLVDSASFLVGLLAGAEEQDVAVELSWLFAFVTAKPEEAVVEEFLRCGLAQALVRRLAAADALSPTTVPVVRALGNLTSGPIEWLDRVLSSGNDAAHSVVRLTCPGGGVHRAVLKEALWLASNILGGRPAHRDFLLLAARPCVLQTPSSTVFGAGLSAVQTPLSIVDNLLAVVCSAEFDLQREALMAMQNAAAEPAVVRAILGGPDAGAALLSSLVQLLRVPGDSEVVMASLRLVHVLLECDMAAGGGGGVGGRGVWDAEGLTDAVDDIQYGQHEEEVLRSAAALADRLYEGMEGADAEVTGGIAASAFMQQAISAPVAGGLGRGKHLLTPSWMNNS